MTVLKTADDWWAEVAIVKEGIKEWGPPDDPVGRIADHPLAPGRFGKKLVAYYQEHRDQTFWQIFEELEKARNSLVWDILQSIWVDTPDKSYIHEWKYWGRFCDLCSEGMHLIKGWDGSEDVEEAESES